MYVNEVTVRPSLGLGLPVMQCDDEVLDNRDPEMYCLELSEKNKFKKRTILILTLSIVAVITLNKSQVFGEH